MAPSGCILLTLVIAYNGILVHEDKTTLKHVNVILSSLLKSRPKLEYCSFTMSVHLTLIPSVVCLEIKYALNPGILSSVFPGDVLNPETTINSWDQSYSSTQCFRQTRAERASRRVTWLEFWIEPSPIDTISLHMHTHTQFWIAPFLILSLYISLPTGRCFVFFVTGTRFAGGEKNPTRLLCPSNRGMSLSFFLFVISSDKNSRYSLKLLIVLDALSSSSGRSKLNKSVQIDTNQIQQKWLLDPPEQMNQRSSLHSTQSACKPPTMQMQIHRKWVEKVCKHREFTLSQDRLMLRLRIDVWLF